MAGDILALLVHDQAEPLATLKIALEEQAIQTSRVQNCAEALNWFRSKNRPHIIFTDTMLPDGTWEDVLSSTVKTRQVAGVIVVASEIDLDLYAEAIQCGAFDFIAPPFVATDLVHLVRCAMGIAFGRRIDRPTAA